MSSLDYHSLIQRLDLVLASGLLGAVDRVHLYNGSGENPYQVALKHRKSARIRLVELHKDGILIDPGSQIIDLNNIEAEPDVN